MCVCVQYICEKYFQKIAERSLFTGLSSATHFGRPDFAQFFKMVKAAHPGVSQLQRAVWENNSRPTAGQGVINKQRSETSLVWWFWRQAAGRLRFASPAWSGLYKWVRVKNLAF